MGRVDGEACDFCGDGKVTRRDEEMAFHQWTDRGYVFCKVVVPMSVCVNCGAKTWDENAETIIEDAVRREFEKLK